MRWGVRGPAVGPGRADLGTAKGRSEATWGLGGSAEAGPSARGFEKHRACRRPAAQGWGGAPGKGSRGPPPGGGFRGRTAGADGASRSRYRSFGLGGTPGRGPRTPSAHGPPGRGGEPAWPEEPAARTPALGRPAEALRWRVTDASRSSESTNTRRRACVRVEISQSVVNRSWGPRKPAVVTRMERPEVGARALSPIGGFPRSPVFWKFVFL